MPVKNVANQSGTPIDTEATANQLQHMFDNGQKDKVWNDLGLLIYPKVDAQVSDKSKVGKVTGMLVDLTTLSIKDILEAVNDEAVLIERIEEALEMINSSATN